MAPFKKPDEFATDADRDAYRTKLVNEGKPLIEALAAFGSIGVRYFGPDRPVFVGVSVGTLPHSSEITLLVDDITQPYFEMPEAKALREFEIGSAKVKRTKIKSFSSPSRPNKSRHGKRPK